MIIDCEQSNRAELYKLMISIVVPRPIAWISTINKAGVPNLAPFSFFNAFSVDPPILGIGIGSKRDLDDQGQSFVRPKDTFLNIEETGEFVVNMTNKNLAQKMNQSSANYKSHEDEFEKVGLTAVPSEKIIAPRVKECDLSMECSLYQSIPLGATNLVLGKILVIHAHDSIYKDGAAMIESCQPIGRLGGTSYCHVDSIFDIPRPEV